MFLTSTRCFHTTQGVKDIQQLKLENMVMFQRFTH